MVTDEASVGATQTRMFAATGRRSGVTVHHTTQMIPDMVIPSAASTAAFVAVVAFVFLAFMAFFARAYRDRPGRMQIVASAGFGMALWMVICAALAHFGVISEFMGSPKVMGYFFATNAVALALALSPAGRTLVDAVPIAWLVGFQVFRLPLELVLHSWYDQGTLPVQMTYEGHNLDIATGILALLCGAALRFGELSRKVRRGLVLAFNVVGTGLLVMVGSIAARSTPGPVRTYLEDPPVLLAAYVPYTWIVPMCVGGALCGHALVFRWLWRTRGAVDEQ